MLSTLSATKLEKKVGASLVCTCVHLRNCVDWSTHLKLCYINNSIGVRRVYVYNDIWSCDPPRQSLLHNASIINTQFRIGGATLAGMTLCAPHKSTPIHGGTLFHLPHMWGWLWRLMFELPFKLGQLLALLSRWFPSLPFILWGLVEWVVCDFIAAFLTPDLSGSASPVLEFFMTFLEPSISLASQRRFLLVDISDFLIVTF